MDLALAPEEEELVTVLDAALAKESSPDRVRAAEVLGFDGAVGGAQPDRRALPGPRPGRLHGGAAGLVAETAGRHLASAPVVESLVTARLLRRCGGPEADAPAERCEEGRIATLVLHPARGPSAELVPAGALAHIVLTHDDDALTAAVADPPMAAAPNLGGMPLADRDLSGDAAEVRTLARAAPARLAFETARSEGQLLTAAQLVGLAARALEIAVGYVRERHVFGRPVGSFQSVAHTLADHATAVDGARLLVREAAWAADVDDPRARALAAMAFCYAAELAVAVAGDALHFHGGYGFTTEDDIQLYYRRARAYPLVWGSVQREFQRVADLLFGEAGKGRDGRS